MPESIADFQSVKVAEYPYGPQPPVLPFDEDPQKESAGSYWQSRGRLIPAVALTAIFVIADFSIVPLMSKGPVPGISVVFVFMLIGAIFAQAALLSLPLVFGEGSFGRRLTTCASATIVFWGVWQMGFVAAMPYHPMEYVETIQHTGLALPLAAIALQWPLWFFRLYLGWRLKTSGPATTAARPLSIRDYLLGTALVALAIALARRAPPDVWDTNDYWDGWAIFSAFAGVTSLAVAVPIMILMLRLRDWRIAYCLTLAYGFVAGVVAVGVLLATLKSFRDDVLKSSGLWEAASLVAAYAMFGLFFGAGLFAGRAMGIELVFGAAQDESTSPAPITHIINAPRAGSHAKE